MNHRSVFYILEAKGFPKEDLALIRQMYNGTSLVMNNHFGRSAAITLSRGMPQGAMPSPPFFITVFDPFNSIIRHYGRGCTLQGRIAPTGNDVFADDSTLHTDGPDAIPAMAIMAPPATGYLEWAGMEINLKKCGITAMDMRTGQQVATDSVTHHGEPFPVIPPGKSHKHLGLRVALNGDFSAEKQHVRAEMQQRLAALAEDRVLSRAEKEIVIKTAVCSVFRYSAGFVNWTKTELDSISKMWIRAYKQAWTLPGSIDSSPVILDKVDGGRGCPSAADMWTREVYDTIEQCVSVPGEISRITTHYLQQQCVAHGCKALNQFQLLLRVQGNAETVLERFLLRLDEQGLEISSPWEARVDRSLLEALWPRLYSAWLEKERWAGCTEVIDTVQNEWNQAQLCLKACVKLGNADPAIIYVTHLLDSQQQWLPAEALKHRKCHLSPLEHAALISWLSEENVCEMSVKVPLEQTEVSTQSVSPTLAAQEPFHIPPCIRGQIIGEEHSLLILTNTPPKELPDLDIPDLSDQRLADYLCKTRTVFPLMLNADDIIQVECLLPLRIMSPSQSQLEYIIVKSLTDDDAPLTVMQMALVRDCLKGADRERLDEACGRPNWTVTKAEYYAGHCIHKPDGCRPPTWKLQVGSTAQTEITGLVQYITQRRCERRPRPAHILQPWQTDPPLPSRIVIDVSHHHPKKLPAPVGWEVIQRNGRVWIAEQNNRVAKMDAAQYHMLLATSGNQNVPKAPTEQLLSCISDSCRAQSTADLEFFVHWSRHLLASIQKITKSELLIGASAVTYNPHFHYFSSPYLPDVHLGAVTEWPQVPALLIIDSFAPHLRRQLLEKAMIHNQVVWILRQHKGNPDDPDLAILNKTARLYAELPKKSLILHQTDCWEVAAWDVKQSSCSTQLWQLRSQITMRQQDPELLPTTVQQHLNCDKTQRYAFHWYDGEAPPNLLLYQKHQQDALRHSWDGLIAGTDGSVDERTERMGAGYVLGADPAPTLTFFARVGGPLATTRAEAASLLQLLLDVRASDNHNVNLLVFVDCLVVLDILSKWGRNDFYPEPKEIVHFDVICPLLHVLRHWTGNVTLVKIKSHTGCLMNERADELAELGRKTEGPEICPGPQKYGSFWLRTRQAVRELAESSGKPLPRDSAPNRSLLEKTAASNTLRAVKKRSTVFVTDLLHHKEGATVSKIIQRCAPAEYRIWLKCMTGTYPVQTYLNRIGVAKSPICLHCPEAVPESLTHFACVCPKFREARTSAHNQVRDVITSFLRKHVGPAWKVYEETPMAKTGLVLRPTDHATIEQIGRRQPDWLLVSTEFKRIAIPDLCRPSDVLPIQIPTAAKRKQHAYSPLVEALSYYTEQGWIVHIFPWVVGIRGMIDPVYVESLLKFIGIQRKLWKVAVERSVLASVRAFHYLHKVRFGGLSRAVCPDPDPSNSDSEQDVSKENISAKRRSRRSHTNLAQDYTDSDSSPDSTVGNRPPKRLPPKALPSRHQSAREDSTGVSGTQQAAAKQKSSKKCSTKRRSRATRPTASVIHERAQTSSADTRSAASRKPPKRKRWDRITSLDSDNPDQRPTKQLQCTTDDQPEALWTRWRQLEPRRGRRT